jgi:selenocysteine lyase/cysteine desulfurase
MFSITRRSIIALSLVGPTLAAAGKRMAERSAGLPQLPAKVAFADIACTYLDSASTHPLPLACWAKVEAYLFGKTRDKARIPTNFSVTHNAVMTTFGQLVGATAEELTLVQSTTMGENLVLRALGIPQVQGRIVTDVLHYSGSFYTYSELKKSGMDVVTLPMTAEGKISYKDFEDAIDGKTRLVSVTAVSATNGFEHDLKRICDIAHAHGAYVYVDIVQAVGANPVDLRSAGVDFAASASYKWLMGDFGLGFLYVRKEIQHKIQRPWFGPDQTEVIPHVFPFDEPSDQVATYSQASDADGLFAMGTTCRTVEVMLSASLPWIRDLGPSNIRVWRQPMIDAIQSELRSRGYQAMTPIDSKTQIVTFVYRGAEERLAARLDSAKVKITLLPNRFRVGVSIFNDMNDVDRLLSALPARG